MFLEIHDDEAPTLCGVARNIDYEYQAEQWVIDSCSDDNKRTPPKFVLWVLFSAIGEPIRAWKRTGDTFEPCPVPPSTNADARSLAPRRAG